jgi:hypothetical protein
VNTAGVGVVSLGLAASEEVLGHRDSEQTRV